MSWACTSADGGGRLNCPAAAALFALGAQEQLSSGALADGRRAGLRVLQRSGDYEEAVVATQEAARRRAQRQDEDPPRAGAPRPVDPLAPLVKTLERARAQLEGLLQAERSTADARLKARLQEQLGALQAWFAGPAGRRITAREVAMSASHGDSTERQKQGERLLAAATPERRAAALLVLLISALALIFSERHSNRAAALFPPGLFGNRLFLHAALRIFFLFLAANAIGLFSPSYLREVHHVDARALGFILLVNPLLSLLIAGWAGRAADTRPRRMIAIGLLLGALGTALLAATASPVGVGVFIGIYFITGLGGVLCMPALNKVFRKSGLVYSDSNRL